MRLDGLRLDKLALVIPTYADFTAEVQRRQAQAYVEENVGIAKWNGIQHIAGIKHHATDYIPWYSVATLWTEWVAGEVADKRKCPICKQPVPGRSNRVFCSLKCRVAAHRKSAL